MFTLRDYQLNAVGEAIEFFRNGKHKDIPIIVAPTAAGKSLYVAHIASELRAGVLVLQPTKELLDQNYEKFKSYGGTASIYSASAGKKEISSYVTFATIGSIKNKVEQFRHIKYVIIDECHKVPPAIDKYDDTGLLIKNASTYMKFLNQLEDVKTIGLTATPFRKKTYVDPFSSQTYTQINLLTRERPKFFNKFLYITQIGELYEKGYLSPLRYIELPWDSKALDKNSTGAEYTDDSVDYALLQQKVYERIPALIAQSIAKGRKHRIVFVKNVMDAINLAATVPDSACVHSDTKPSERDEILKDFKAGKIATVFNVGVLTEGFDFPALDTIFLARPTMSLSLYMQMLGRGMRPHTDKTDCAVVDMCGNIARFGRIEKIVYVEDEDGKMVIRNEHKQLSGVRLE